jgi:hypothetical protein
MRQLNTIPIETFLDKARIARKSNQNSITLSVKEYNELYDSLATIMTRLSGELTQSPDTEDPIQIKMTGGTF